MIPITLDSLEHYALPYVPDAASGFSATFRVDTDQVESLTKREVRRSLGATLRVTDFSLNYILDSSVAAEFRSALRVLQDTRVRIPFWPALMHWQFSGKWFYHHTEGDAPGKVENIAFDHDDGGIPTLLGHFSEEPSFNLLTPSLTSVGVRFKESSPADEALVSEVGSSWAEGPQIGSRTIYVFPFTPDWAEQLGAGKVEVEVKRQDIGFSRESASQVYPQIGRRRPVFPFTMQGDDAATMLKFYLDRQGAVEAFWLPCWLAEVQLAADTSAGSANVVVDNAALIADHNYLAFYTPTGGVVTRKIVSRDGNTLTLDSSPGALPAAGTVLCTLALARFAGNELTIRFNSSIAMTQIEFVELPQEYITPSGETYHETLGDLPSKAFLFKVQHGDEIWRWTNYESELLVSGNTYSVRPVEFGEIVDAFAWESASSTLKSRHFADNPFSRLITGTLQDRLEVWIWECEPANPGSTLNLLFRGFVTEADFDGPFITARMESMGSLFGLKVPRTLLQPTDNYALFDAGNRLDLAEWTFLADVIFINDRLFSMANFTWPQGTLPEIPENYFAFGYVERPAPNFTRIPILSSTAMVDEFVTIELAWKPDMSHAEGDWKLIPGYDGQARTAQGKFDNLASFGGFPFVPATNPTLTPLKKSDSNSGKK